ncbi:MAG: hypothetical protein Kow0068_09200 [Marinilabiliales bacterium]
MKTLKFKTNINCPNCLAKVKNILDTEIGNKNWNVDILNENKILTINTVKHTKEDIINLINKVGFKAESID